jgi:hypothetical protein
MGKIAAIPGGAEVYLWACDPPWLVGILLRDLLLLPECLLKVVGVLGFPRLPSPYSDFLRERWLMFEGQRHETWAVVLGC